MARAKTPKPRAAKIDTRKAQEVWKLPQAEWESLLSPADGYQRKGEHHKVRCWGGHADEHPSMTITPHREKGGIGHCFACGLTILNPVTLLSKVRKEKLADTAKFLRQKHGLKVLTVAVTEQLESEANRARLKSAIIQLCCDLLKQAVACGIDDEALSKAQLYWAKPALEYLVSRMLGGVALDAWLWSTICGGGIVTHPGRGIGRGARSSHAPPMYRVPEDVRGGGRRRLRHSACAASRAAPCVIGSWHAGAAAAITAKGARTSAIASARVARGAWRRPDVTRHPRLANPRHHRRKWAKSWIESWRCHAPP